MKSRPIVRVWKHCYEEILVEYDKSGTSTYLKSSETFLTAISIFESSKTDEPKNAK
jgi:hypothetical protein